jgi:PAS domain-containing protein
MPYPTQEEDRWCSALQDAAFGIWDLNPRLETVQYSAPFKARLGFERIHAADSTSFWRSRVHPDDFKPMLRSLLLHLDGYTPSYEMRFRLRAGDFRYISVLSRGRVVERDARGDALRMLGTMVDLSRHWPANRAAAQASAHDASGLDAPAHARLPLEIGDLLDLAVRDARA